MAEHKGLGRGIDAFFTDTFDTLTSDSTKEEVEELDLSLLRPNPYQPRQHFDEESLKELSASIKENGVFQPIIVRASKVQGYEIIAGERRYRASKLAGKTTIPAIIRPLTEAQMMQIAVIENLQREDLTPLEEAEAYQTLMTELNLTQQELSEKLGKSRPYIANYLRLLTLPVVIKTWLNEEKLSVGHARALLAVKEATIQEQLAKKVIQEGLSVRELENLIQEQTKHPKKKKEKNIKNKYFKESERKLSDLLDAKVVIQSSGKRGKIEISYETMDDLNRLLALFHVDLD